MFSQPKDSSHTGPSSMAKNRKINELTFKLGAGIPQGDFADKTLNNPEAGLAKTGVLFEIALSHELNESLYFSLMTQFQFNELENEKFSANATPWRMNHFMAGIGTIFKLSNKTSITSRFMLGYSSIGSPSVGFPSLGDPTLGDTLGPPTIESVNRGSFSCLVGLGLKIKTTKRTDLLIAADYFGANVDFKTLIIKGYTITTTNLEQQIRMVNLSIGFVFKI